MTSATVQAEIVLKAWINYIYSDDVVEIISSLAAVFFTLWLDGK